MTPVIVLSDGYIANGSEPWKIPGVKELKKFKKSLPKSATKEEKFQPYERNSNLVREWASPGLAGFEHRIGGLEKKPGSGAVSYDPDDHAEMSRIRDQKVKKISELLPEEEFIQGNADDECLVLGWGSTYGAIETAVTNLRSQGASVAHVHLRHIFPFKKNLGDILRQFDSILIPELNGGQLAKLIRDEFLLDPISYTKLEGLPLTVDEITSEIQKNLAHHVSTL